MDARSEKIIRQIVSPEGVPDAERPEPASEPMSLSQVVFPRSAEPSGYVGPERRAQGYLIAEVVEEARPSDASRFPDSPA